MPRRESTRHAAAGVIDTGFELVYPSSTQRVAVIAGLLKRYSKEPFTEDSGSHMLLLHVLNRLRRVGGSLSMLPSTNVTFDDEQLNEAVVPLQLWLRMLDRKNSRSRKERRPSRGIKIDAAPLVTRTRDSGAKLAPRSAKLSPRTQSFRFGNELKKASTPVVVVSWGGFAVPT